MREVDDTVERMPSLREAVGAQRESDGRSCLVDWYQLLDCSDFHDRAGFGHDIQLPVKEHRRVVADNQQGRSVPKAGAARVRSQWLPTTMPVTRSLGFTTMPR